MIERPATGRFQRFCIVGLGNHARTKLIPALTANGQEIAGLVTRGDGMQGVFRFPNVDEAIAALPQDTVFVIATPPTMHSAQAILAIRAGRDVIVEKPAFVTEQEAQDCVAEASRQGSILVEGFMHRHTQLYRRLVEFWHARRSSMKAIEATFLIPEMPAGTFRQEPDVACSGLYDVGAYPLSLLSDLDLPLQDLRIDAVDFPGDQAREAVHLAGVLGEIRRDIRIGVNAAYANRVSLHTAGGAVAEFSPFFYGRPGDRTISQSIGPDTTSETIRDLDAFQEMFAVPRNIWQESQAIRSMRMIDVAAALERLGASLSATRPAGGR
jgi:hypothetical protein